MKIMVGLSGGVDSAAAAYLLKEQGYEVAGATFRLMDDWDEAKDAKAVADYLGIPHYVFDFREIFKKEVLDNFVALANELNFTILGLTFSPVKGPEGNIEFLGHLTLAEKEGIVPDTQAVVAAAHAALKG